MKSEARSWMLRYHPRIPLFSARWCDVILESETLRFIVSAVIPCGAADKASFKLLLIPLQPRR